MNLLEYVPVLVTVLGAITAAYAAWSAARNSRRATEVQGAAEVLKGYEAFCDDLRDRIAQLTAHMQRNEARIETLEHELREAREENERLRGEVTRLTTENEMLHAEIAMLRNRLAGLEAKGC